MTEGGAAAPKQQAAQALQEDPLCTCLASSKGVDIDAVWR